MAGLCLSYVVPQPAPQSIVLSKPMGFAVVVFVMMLGAEIGAVLVVVAVPVVAIVLKAMVLSGMVNSVMVMVMRLLRFSTGRLPLANVLLNAMIVMVLVVLAVQVGTVVDQFRKARVAFPTRGVVDTMVSNLHSAKDSASCSALLQCQSEKKKNLVSLFFSDRDLPGPACFEKSAEIGEEFIRLERPNREGIRLDSIRDLDCLHRIVPRLQHPAHLGPRCR